MADETSKLETVWGRREVGLDFKSADIMRPTTHMDVEYLLNRYPFLEIANPSALIPAEVTPKLITAKSGWTIHDYGYALKASPGEYLYGGGDYKGFIDAILKAESDEGEGGEDGTVILPGKGTIIKQMFDTAAEMIQIIISHHWPVAIIIAGNPLMQWAAWMEAQDQGFDLEGYEPDEKAEAKRRRIRELTSKIEPSEVPTL